MKFLKKNIQYILLAIILCASLCLRVNQLNIIPVGMTDDEVREVYSAYSLWHTGRDLTQGIFLPFSFVLHDFSFTPVPVYITAPFVGLFGLSPASARLPFALAGVGVVFLTYLLIKRLLGNPAVALLSAAVLAINVWAIQLSRMAYEAEFALLFYLWGTYIFLGNWKKHPYGSALGSMAVLFLAFNSYNATKLVYIPLLLVLLWYKRKEIAGKKYLLGVVAGSVLATIGIFAYFTFFQGASAHGGYFLIFQDTGAAAQAVELARRASSAPHILQVLYHNKLTYFIDQVTSHYLYAFSPDYLFLNQEGSGIYSLWSRGNFYLIALPFLFIGLFSLWKRQSKLFIFATLAVIIAALPSGIGPPPFTYATRSSFMLPWLALFMAFGIYSLVQSVKFIKIRIILTALIIAVYAYYVGGYLTQYYFEWPRYSAKSFAEDQKDIISYINHYPDKQAKFVITNVSDMFFLQYAFYTHTDPRQIQQLYRTSEKPTEFAHMTVIPTCIATSGADPRGFVPVGTIYITSSACHTQQPDDALFLPDGEQMWNMYKGAVTL
ncbi:MAG: glycosyltransferase family 39 protein [Candidatus Gottesmanbacteria bacterium]|nr:glycosyltransferase family 39 protein [Candidatus Gottesmanbacteria bacterium]